LKASIVNNRSKAFIEVNSRNLTTSTSHQSCSKNSFLLYLEDPFTFNLIKNLEAKFGDEVKSKRVYKTPETPIIKIVCPENDDDIIEPNLQSRYRSGVGIMLYLIKYS
jgi:hypothetical protein